MPSAPHATASVPAPPRERPDLARARLLDDGVRPRPAPLPAAHAARARALGRRAAGGLGLARRTPSRSRPRSWPTPTSTSWSCSAPRRPSSPSAGWAAGPDATCPPSSWSTTRRAAVRPRPPGIRWPTATTCCSCTSRTSTTSCGTAGPRPPPSSSTASSTPGTATPASSRPPRSASTSRSAGAGSPAPTCCPVRPGRAARRLRDGHRRAGRAPGLRPTSAPSATCPSTACTTSSPAGGSTCIRAVDLARALPARGDAPGHAGGRAGDHRGARGRAAGRRGLLHRRRAAARRPARAGRGPAAGPGRGAAGRAHGAAPLRPRPFPRPAGTPCWTGPSRARSAGGAPASRRREGGDAVRIAMVSEHASPLAAAGGLDAGGQNVHVSELGTALAAAGHEVTVWTRRDDDRTPDLVTLHPGVDGAHTSTAGPRAPIPKDELVPHLPAFAGGLGADWAAQRPDVVHAHFWMSGWPRCPRRCRRTSRSSRPSTPSAASSDATRAATTPARPAGSAAERAVARRADRVLATCNDEVFELARLGAPRRRVSVVPCGVDTAAFSPDGPSPAARAAADRRARPPRAPQGRRRGDRGAAPAAGGRAPRRGRAGRLRRALRRTGPRPRRARLQHAAAAAGVADRVRLLGAVARPDVPALLRSADAVVCVPWYEPFGIVPLEAMACGRPVVASAVGGIQDTVVDEVTGLLVPPRRPDVAGGRAADAARHPDPGVRLRHRGPRPRAGPLRLGPGRRRHASASTQDVLAERAGRLAGPGGRAVRRAGRLPRDDSAVLGVAR